MYVPHEMPAFRFHPRRTSREAPPGLAAALRLSAVAAAVLLLALPPSGHAQVPGRGLEEARRLGERFLLVRDATVIDGTGGLPRRDASVLIRNGVIEAVGRSEDMMMPEGTDVVDAGGGWLVPGFIDVHADARDTSVIRGLIAAGVTTIRSPGSPIGDEVDYRRVADQGDVAGPRVLSAGPVIDAPPGHWPGSVLVETAEEARAAVRAQAERGAEVIKLYAHLPSALVAAAVEEAHEHGLEVVGDLVMTSWTEAARAGIDHLSHVVSRSPDLLPAEAREAYRRDVSEGRAHPYYRWLEALDLDGRQVDEMLGALLSRDVSVDPTLAATESVLFCSDPEYTAELASYLPEATGTGSEGLAPRCVAEEWPEDFLERAREAWPKALALVRLLHDQGVRLAAGSNAPFGRFPPGASFHRELELLSEAGISGREILRIATANGAVTLGILHEAGTIEPGKRADMVLLRSDPLRDIRATRDIEWVMLDAEIYRPAAAGEAGREGVSTPASR